MIGGLLAGRRAIFRDRAEMMISQLERFRVYTNMKLMFEFPFDGCFVVNVESGTGGAGLGFVGLWIARVMEVFSFLSMYFKLIRFTIYGWSMYEDESQTMSSRFN